jgi:hypothetical protein
LLNCLKGDSFSITTVLFNEIHAFIPYWASEDDNSNEKFIVEKEINDNVQGNKITTRHTTNPYFTSYRLYPLKQGKTYRLYLTYDYWFEKENQYIVKVVSSNILKVDFVHQVIVIFFKDYFNCIYIYIV